MSSCSIFEKHFSRRVIETHRPGKGKGLGQDSESVGLHWGFPFPESFPTEDLAEAARQALREDGQWACQYGGGEKTRLLTDLIRGRLKDRGLRMEGRDLVVTNGASQALDMVGSVFLDPGDLVLVEAPTFLGALYTLGSHLVQYMSVDMGPDGPGLDQLEADLAGRRAEGRELPKLMYTIPNFHNPTGVTAPVESRQRLLDLARAYDFLVVEDDAYGELYFAEQPPSTVQELDSEGRVIYVGTLSKIIAPGIRIGWTLAPTAASEQLARLKGDGATNPFMQSTVAQYWDSGDLDRRVRWLRDQYRERWQALDGALSEHMPDGISWSRPGGGFFVWVTLPEGYSAKRVAQEAGRRGVTVLPGDPFFPPNSVRPALRLSFSFCPPEELRRGVKILSGVLSDLASGAQIQV